jgi:CDP-diacylglycerol--serine O-phosphatidyltransferase
MGIKSSIPNIITLLNLFCGCIAVVFAFNENFELALLFVALGIFLDFFDGFFARIFKVSSPLGVQLDSLADMVTSGVAPGIIMFFLMRNALQVKAFSVYDADLWMCFAGFVITLGSCYRLAYFNIDTRQTDSFIGLPTPANALFILSLPLILKYTDSIFVLELLTNYWFLLFITIMSAYILNAEIPLFSLKIKKMNFRDNLLQISFLAVALLLLAFFRYAGLALVIVFYVATSIVVNQLNKK